MSEREVRRRNTQVQTKEGFKKKKKVRLPEGVEKKRRVGRPGDMLGLGEVRGVRLV